MDGWLRPKAAAEYCSVGERTLRTWLKSEGLRSSKIRGTTQIKINWLDRFLESYETTNCEKQVDQLVSEVVRDLN